MKCLITGSTGFLGKYIVTNLVNRFECIYILSRSSSLERTRDLYSKYENISIVEGDIEYSDIIEDFSKKIELQEGVQVLIHAAALYDLEATFSKCNQANVIGTQNVIFFANQCKKLKLFHYVSTIAVAGDFVGTFYESELNVGQRFSNHYSHSKYVAEKFVQENLTSASIRTRVYRLGVLVGDSQSGYYEKIDGPYYIFNLLNKFKFKDDLLKHLKFIVAPFDNESTFPLIPVDIAAKIVCDIDSSLNEKSQYKVYHVIGSEDVKIKEICEEVFLYFNSKLKIISVKDIGLNKYIYRALSIPAQINNYMYSKVKYDITNLDSTFQHIKNPRFNEYKDIMLSTFFNKNKKGDL